MSSASHLQRHISLTLLVAVAPAVMCLIQGCPPLGPPVPPPTPDADAAPPTPSPSPEASPPPSPGDASTACVVACIQLGLAGCPEGFAVDCPAALQKIEDKLLKRDPHTGRTLTCLDLATANTRDRARGEGITCNTLDAGAI